MNERLYPPRTHTSYYHLMELRLALESISNKYFLGNHELVLVDLGCGTKPYLPIFEKHLAEYIGVDLPSNSLADTFVTPDGTIPLLDAFADVVISTQVLEHTIDPISYLKECHRLLKPNGLLILSTHGYWPYHPDPIDYWRWTSSGVKKIIRDADFEIIELRGLMGLAPTALQLFQDSIIRKFNRTIQPILIYVFQFLIRFLDKKYPEETKEKDACTFVIVARQTQKQLTDNFGF